MTPYSLAPANSPQTLIAGEDGVRRYQDYLRLGAQIHEIEVPTLRHFVRRLYRQNLPLDEIAETCKLQKKLYQRCLKETNKVYLNQLLAVLELSSVKTQSQLVAVLALLNRIKKNFNIKPTERLLVRPDIDKQGYMTLPSDAFSVAVFEYLASIDLELLSQKPERFVQGATSYLYRFLSSFHLPSELELDRIARAKRKAKRKAEYFNKHYDCSYDHEHLPLNFWHF